MERRTLSGDSRVEREGGGETLRKFPGNSLGILQWFIGVYNLH